MDRICSPERFLCQLQLDQRPRIHSCHYTPRSANICDTSWVQPSFPKCSFISIYFKSYIKVGLYFTVGIIQYVWYVFIVLGKKFFLAKRGYTLRFILWYIFHWHRVVLQIRFYLDLPYFQVQLSMTSSDFL
jgi:hypothetical protein